MAHSAARLKRTPQLGDYGNAAQQRDELVARTAREEQRALHAPALKHAESAELRLVSLRPRR